MRLTSAFISFNNTIDNNIEMVVSKEHEYERYQRSLGKCTR